MPIAAVKKESWLQSYKLTPREIDVLSCLMERKTTKEIAAILDISTKGVEAHIFNMMQKLDKHTRNHIAEFFKTSPDISQLITRYCELFTAYEFQEKLKKIKKHVFRKRMACKLLCLDEHLKRKITQDLKRVGISCYEYKKNIQTVSVVTDQNYQVIFFEILNKISPHPFIEEAITHFQSEFLPSSSNQKFQQTNMRKPSYLPIEKKNFLVWFFYIFTVLTTAGVIYSQFLHFPLSVRNDLYIPTDAKALSRMEILKKIDRLFKGSAPIKFVVLTGVGGAGKTILARQYAKKTKSPIFWEINAETKETLLHSFSHFAYALSKTQAEKLELEHIKKTENQREYIQKLTDFVKQKLREQKNWLLVFDNLETIEDIRTFLPLDSTTWGNGRVLITTQNRNVAHQEFITQDHVLDISPLTAAEKLLLFLKIQEKSTYDQGKLVDFLQKIPPFPLDVSIAAYYIKNTNNSFDEYLKRLELQNQKMEETDKVLFSSNINKYNKTRYKIIGCAIDQILEKRQEFAELLILICMIDSQNIPKTLLKRYCEPSIVDQFIQQMEKSSLFACQDSKAASLSMHRSIQQNILLYLRQTLSVQKQKLYLHAITIGLENYCLPLLEQVDSARMRIFLHHLHAYLEKTELLDEMNRNIIALLLGSIYCELGDPITAKIFLDQSLKYFNSYYKNKYSSRLLHAVTYAGIAEKLTGNYIQAKELLEQSVTLHQKTSSSDTVEKAKALRHLAYVYKFTDGFEKAKKTIEQSILLYKENRKDEAGLALALSDLATIYCSVGQYQQAVAYRSNSLSVTKQLCGRKHINTLLILGALGLDFRRIGNYGKALEFFNGSYKGIQKYHADNFEQLNWLATNLGEIYRILGLYKQAKAFLTQGLEIAKKHFGVTHTYTDWTTISLGQLYLEQGDYKTAACLLEKSLKGYHKHFGVDEGKTLNIYLQLGVVYTYLGFYQKAHAFFEKSLDAYIKRSGKHHTDYALALKEYGLFYLVTGKLEIAEKLFKEALDILQKADHQGRYKCFEYLGDLYEKKVKLMPSSNSANREKIKAQAISFYNKALNIVCEHFPKESIHLARIQEKLNTFQFTEKKGGGKMIKFW